MTLKPIVFLATMLAGCAAAPPPPKPAPPPSPPPEPVLPKIDPVPPPRDDGRLPSGARPTSYALELNVDPEQKTFTGRVRIGVALEQPSQAIVMHGRGLKVKVATLHSSRGDVAGSAQLRMAAGGKEEPEELVIVLAQEAPAGDVELELQYEAPFGRFLGGMYQVEDGGASYAFTDFEPNDARRVFPCFDEPGFKTPFELTVTVPKGSIAVSNMKEARRRDGLIANMVTFEFEKSPPLPTYLVAVGVGPFEVLEGPKEPVPIRVLAGKGKSGLGKLAIAAAAAHLDLLGRYFDRGYPYTKLDLVAVPNFASGAMEHPGFVTFREELLLLDPEHASTEARHAQASVIAHELAHQWFGNLVTMQWWDDLWLNEAFATWMSRKVVDQWKPAWQFRTESLSEKSSVMAHDSLASARKIRNPVHSTGDALEAFDDITYEKGEAVLTMIESWLGETTFREGMRSYVKKHEWGNATAADLYSALQEAGGGRDVAKVMNTFTDQTGVPLVSATLVCPASGNATEPIAVQLRQEEYRTLERNEPTSKLWQLPICVAYDSGDKLEKHCTLLDSAEARVELGARGGKAAVCPSYVYANAGEAGYARVQLERGDLEKLARTGFGKTPDAERFGILSNAWAGVWSGHLPAPAYFELVRSLKKETSRLVWREVIDSLYLAERALVTDAARPAFAKFVRDVLGPTARRLGWTVKKDESDDQKVLRVVVLDAIGALGEDDWAFAQAKRIADIWIEDPFKVDHDLARVAVPLAARHGDDALFDSLAGVLSSAKTPEVRVIALSGLSGFDKSEIVNRALGLMFDRKMRAEDLYHLFRRLRTRRATRDTTYAWMEKHFDDLAKFVPRFMLGKFVLLTASMCDAARVHAAEAFFAPRIAKIDGAAKDLRQSVEEGLRCAALFEKESAPTAKWLATPTSAQRAP